MFAGVVIARSQLDRRDRRFRTTFVLKWNVKLRSDSGHTADAKWHLVWKRSFRIGTSVPIKTILNGRSHRNDTSAYFEWIRLRMKFIQFSTITVKWYWRASASSSMRPIVSYRLRHLCLVCLFVCFPLWFRCDRFPYDPIHGENDSILYSLHFGKWMNEQYLHAVVDQFIGSPFSSADIRQNCVHFFQEFVAISALIRDYLLQFVHSDPMLLTLLLQCVHQLANEQRVVEPKNMFRLLNFLSGEVAAGLHCAASSSRVVSLRCDNDARCATAIRSHTVQPRTNRWILRPHDSSPSLRTENHILQPSASLSDLLCAQIV